MVTTMSTMPALLKKDNKTEIIKHCSSLNDVDVLRQTIYHLGLQVVHGEVIADLAVSTFYEIIKSNEQITSILSDVITILDIESQVLGQIDSNKRENFIEFLKLANNNIVSDWLLKERLDYSTLADAKVINNEKAASTKFIKLKTKLYYKQQKFNLFREESEGYSKLFTELCQDGQFDPDYMLNTIKSLIGCFNLDPNRVLDIILECFEARLYLRDSFLKLIKNFSNNPVTLNQILAFKFSFYNDNDNGIEDPSALYDVVALLLHNNLIHIESLYPYLSPSDSKICEIYQNDINEAKNFPKKISAILSVEGAKHEDINIFEEVRSQHINGNQKLGFILALLKLGDWPNAQRLMQMLPEYFAISYPDIGDALSQLIHYLIGPLYKRMSTLPSILSTRIHLPDGNYSFEPIENMNEFRTKIMPMILTFGPYLYRDPMLMTKLLRIIRSALQANFNDFRYEIINLLNVTILPSFSLIESNSALGEELWSLMRLFPYNERFLLYNIWKVEPTNPLLIKMKCFTMRRIKYIMKRISKDKDSIKQSGRSIGKLSHSNPTFLFEYMLGQIQSYDNLIGPVVDSLKYLSSVSYDVLLFCVIEALSNPSREHSKHEGTSISPWLLSLANFCGSAIKKYQIELPGLLQFVANQLKLGKCLDLLILKEIVQKMTGIETSEEMTNEQIEALSGGELLRTEGGSFNQIRNIKKSTLRLKEALLENNLAMPLCILMAQQRNCIVFQSENTHLKLIGKLYDQCQETLVQYGNFLSNSLTIDDYKRRLPSLKELLLEYHLSPDVTFFLMRPMISHDITSVFEELVAQRTGEKSKQVLFECFNQASEMVLNPMVESIKPALSSQVSIDLNARFFISFWTLTMYDLQVPEKSYLRERNKINQQIQILEDSKDMVISKKRKEKDRLISIITKLTNEAQQQNEHVTKVMHRLENEKKHWFESNVNKIDVTTNFLQHCLIPRCKFTALDALYCARFVHFLHCLKTPNFSTLICLDRIFGDISNTMSSCTENEANHYGRFLCAILVIVMRWHKDIKVFEVECAKYPGFVTKFCEKDPVHIDYESYRHVCHKWHYRLTKAFILCLDSGDYIQIRNSLIVLTKLLPHFPVMISFAQAIERRLEKIRTEEKEKRPDLFVLATGYSGQLKSRKGTFIPESEFHEKESKKMQSSNSSSFHQQQQAQQQKDSDGSQNQSQAKSEMTTIEIKKESYRGDDVQKLSSSNSSKSSKSSSSKTSSSRIVEPETTMESSSKKYKSESMTRIKKSEEKTSSLSISSHSANSKDQSTVASIKIESRASSASSSPKRGDYRINKDDIDSSINNDYRKRKLESTRGSTERDLTINDKRFKESEMAHPASSLSQPTRSASHEKKSSLRKRQTKDSTPSSIIQEAPDMMKQVRKTKDDSSGSSRKNASESSSSKRQSRRYKTDVDK